ncbi:MAG: DUF3568 family protein [Nitrospiraceae bacterium]|nr:MAG: DUF3568 family protein [Nitrospiraceae bacterium]
MKKIKNCVLLLCVAFLLSGCAEALLIGAGAGMGVGTYMYVDGSLIVEYPLEYSRAWDAANTALERFQISISQSTNDAGKGVIAAVRQDGKKVTVKLKDKGFNVTSIGIRVGSFGDRVESQKIHDEIVSIAGI